MGLFGRNKEKEEKKIALFPYTFIEGLDLPPGSFCDCIFYHDRLVIKGKTKEYVLSFDKIMNYSSTSVPEGQTSTIKDGIGSAPKISSKTRFIPQMMISYQSNSGMINIVLRDYLDPKYGGFTKFINTLKKLRPISEGTERIEL